MKNGNMPASPTIGTINRVTQAFDEAQVDNNDFMLFGLTKREKLAAMAMQGLLADPNTTAEPPLVAKVSAQYADALLAELEKQNDQA